MALSDDDRAALSAYLDGELDDDATHQIEVRLASDPVLRIEYDTLRQTWSLLDYLPRATPSVEFTHRTLSRLTLERHSGTGTWISGLARRVPTLTLAWAAGVLLAVGVGVALGGWLTRPLGLETADGEEEWLRTQPLAVRDQFLALAATDRQQFIHNVRAQQRQQRDAWQAAARDWNRANAGALGPVRLADLSPVDEEGVREYLIPFLSPAEHDRLKQSEGQFPGYVTTLVELADKHPLALPGDFGPTSVEQLPSALRQRLARPIPGPIAIPTLIIEKVRARAKGRPWRELAIAVVDNNRIYLKNLKFDRELWASNETCLLEPMVQYLKKYRQTLPSTEIERLTQAANKWPDYPLAIQQLAKRHHWPTPPWATALSGPPEKWDAYRTVKVNLVPPAPRPGKKDGAKLRHWPAERAEAKLHDLGRLFFMHAKKAGNARLQGHDRRRD